MSFMEIDPISLPWQSLYKLLIGSIVPRPIGWISTINPAGQPNLAPFSFFNAVCANPPHVMFAPMVRSSDGSPKDTLNNARQTGDFVVNIATEDLAQAVNLSSTEFPAEVNEFEITGLTPISSIRVKPPRVGESPICFECQVTHIIDIGSEPGSGSVVIGRVVYLHVRDDVIISPDKIDLSRLRPIARLAGNAYCRVSDIFEMTRPKSQING